MRFSLLRYAPLFALCIHCSTNVGASSNDGGSGGAGGSGPSSTGGSGGSSDTGAGGSGAGSPAETPQEYATATCATRDACENDEDCVSELTCAFEIFRAELRPALQDCLSDCSGLDECFSVATEELNPASYEPYAEACYGKTEACSQMGDDWCEYNYFEGADYEAMVVCFDLTCGEVNDCLRTVVFSDVPECTGF